MVVGGEQYSPGSSLHHPIPNGFIKLHTLVYARCNSLLCICLILYYGKGVCVQLESLKGLSGGECHPLSVLSPSADRHPSIPSYGAHWSLLPRWCQFSSLLLPGVSSPQVPPPSSVPPSRWLSSGLHGKIPWRHFILQKGPHSVSEEDTGRIFETTP